MTDRLLTLGQVRTDPSERHAADAVRFNISTDTLLSLLLPLYVVNKDSQRTPGNVDSRFFFGGEWVQ